MASISLLLLAICCFLPLQIFANNIHPLQAAAESNVNFGRNFFKAIGRDGENLVTSPLSAHLALAMTSFGARGDTFKEMKKALHLPKKQINNCYRKLLESLENEKGVVLEIANRMFVQQGFTLKEKFINRVKKVFHSHPQSVNFAENKAAARDINSWVEQKTHENIKNVISPDSLNSDTRLVIVNAVYFNGRWSHPFDASKSTKKAFHTTQSTSIQTKFMKQAAMVNYQVLDHLDATLIEKDYEGEKTSMVIVVPNSRTGLVELERKMVTQDINALVNSSNRDYISLYLPRFKIESTLELNEPLKKMGMRNMFQDSANFSGMTGDPLYVSEVVQKTFIKVGEAGTEAAAATSVITQTRMAFSPPDVEVKVDRPFLFFLLHRSSENHRVVLFSGRVVEPKDF